MCFSCVRMKFVVFIKFNEINRSNDDAGTTNTITNIQCIFSVALIYVHATKRQKKMHLNFCVRLIKANHHFNRFMTFVRQAELSRIIVAHCMEYFLLLLLLMMLQLLLRIMRTKTQCILCVWSSQ